VSIGLLLLIPDPERSTIPIHNPERSTLRLTTHPVQYYTYGKQTSAYFKAKSRENTVRNNVRVIDHIITTIAATSPWLSRSPFASKIDYQPSVARLAGVHERA
jgi:hypothetical protein